MCGRLKRAERERDNALKFAVLLMRKHGVISAAPSSAGSEGIREESKSTDGSMRKSRSGELTPWMRSTGRKMSVLNAKTVSERSSAWLRQLLLPGPGQKKSFVDILDAMRESKSERKTKK